MSQPAPLTPEIIGRAIDNTPLNGALKLIIAVAAAGFLFDSFDITIVGYALPKIRDVGMRQMSMGINEAGEQRSIS